MGAMFNAYNTIKIHLNMKNIRNQNLLKYQHTDGENTVGQILITILLGLKKNFNGNQKIH